MGLKSQLSTGDLRQVKVVLELSGELKLNGDGQIVVRVPVRVRGDLVYSERVLERGTGPRAPVRTVRAYETARATIAYRDRPVESVLREDRNLIVAAAPQGEQATVFSPLGPLTCEELDLIDVPGNSALIECLLPERVVRPGDKWELDTPRLAPLFGLDTLTDGGLQCELNRIEQGMAIVYVTGTVSGAVGGVASDVRVAAKYAYDTRVPSITWLAMSLQENRSIGHAEPGLEVTAKIQVSCTPLHTAPLLQDQVLAGLDLKDSEPLRLLEFRSTVGGFGLLLDRRWHPMIDRADVTVLRLVDRGELVAQCNLSKLPRLSPGEKFGMPEFQADIKRVLGDTCEEFVTASESITDNEVHFLRVVVAGTVSDMPIQWVYYHLSNKLGQRASAVFTLEAGLVESFAALDQTLISSFEFTVPSDSGSTPSAVTAQRPESDPGAVRK